MVQDLNLTDAQYDHLINFVCTESDTTWTKLRGDSDLSTLCRHTFPASDIFSLCCSDCFPRCVSCMPHIGKDELVTVSFRLWLMASHGDRELALLATMRRCAELEGDARDALKRAAVKSER